VFRYTLCLTQLFVDVVVVKNMICRLLVAEHEQVKGLSEYVQQEVVAIRNDVMEENQMDTDAISAPYHFVEGARGARGIPGLNGMLGSPGFNGETGPQGPSGQQGAIGPSGPQVNPV